VKEWQEINQMINKFFWNKNLSNNTAPARIKKVTMMTPVSSGGFGMIDIQEVVTALKLRRHFFLTTHNVHPMHDLISKLTEQATYLSNKPMVELDQIVTINMNTLRNKRLKDCQAPEWLMEGDLILHTNLLNANVTDFIRIRKRLSNEAQQLRRRDMIRLSDVILNQQNLGLFCKIVQKELLPIIRLLARLYRDSPIPPALNYRKI
jgi:hypothetical protein